MALLSVQSVGRPSQKAEVDPIDRILQGLKIAQGVFGIRSDIQRFETLAAQESRAGAQATALAANQERQTGFQDAAEARRVAAEGRNVAGEARNVTASEQKGKLFELELQRRQQVLSGGGDTLKRQLDQARLKEINERTARQERVRTGTLTPKEERERKVPGFGIALTKGDAKAAKAAIQSRAEIQKMINDIKALRKKHGGEIFDREAVARGKVLSTRLLLKYKDMAKLGVLSVSDEKLLNRLIPKDPLQFDAPGFASTEAQIDELEKTIEGDFSSFLNSRGLHAQVEPTQNIANDNGGPQRGGLLPSLQAGPATSGPFNPDAFIRGF